MSLLHRRCCDGCLTMAYSDFTLAKVKETFDLTLEETQNLFVEVEGVQPSELLTLTLKEYIPLATAINTEKARSELLIAPVLTEVRRQLKYQIALFSGTDFNVDNNKGHHPTPKSTKRDLSQIYSIIAMNSILYLVSN